MNYAKAADIAKLFQSVTSDGGQEGRKAGAARSPSTTAPTASSPISPRSDWTNCGGSFRSWIFRCAR